MWPGFYPDSNFLIDLNARTMWPGFYPDSNFLIDLIRQETAVRGIMYDPSTVPNLLIIGPYGQEWRKANKETPNIFFSAENLTLPQDTSIRLYDASMCNWMVRGCLEGLQIHAFVWSLVLTVQRISVEINSGSIWLHLCSDYTTFYDSMASLWV
jgi:hypothetical protein